jgi:hypothetical protein
MSEVDNNPVVVEGVVSDHRRIREVTTLLLATSDLGGLLKLLAELRGLLERHFVAEEAPDGFYDTMRLAAPRNTGKIDRLKREHSALMTDLERLMAKAKLCLEGKGEVLREASDLTRRLRDHECQEDNLLVDTVYSDLGQGDG